MKSPVTQRDWRLWLDDRPHAGPGERADGVTGWPLWRRRLLHVLMIGFGWFLFFWSWQRVTADRPDVGELRLLLIAAVVVVPAVTLSWVAHNVRIHQRKGPRLAVPTVTMQYEEDFNGRLIAADWTELNRARRIDIVVVGGEKRFVNAALAEARTVETV